MKILFLDIDGVLNTKEAELDSDLVNIFKDMLSKTDAKVVISSSWRHNPYLLAQIQVHVCDYFGLTPCLCAIADIPPFGKSPIDRRGLEIAIWMNTHFSYVIEKYAILDDAMGVMLPMQQPNFFQTMSMTGLTQEIADKVAAHLA